MFTQLTTSLKVDKSLLVFFVGMLLGIILGSMVAARPATYTQISIHSPIAIKPKPSPVQPAVTPTPTPVPNFMPQPAQQLSACVVNTLSSQAIVVSISQRHLWACMGTTQQYDSAVITGMENLAADLTPVGTYQIYSKQTNLYLNGSDSTGSWHDYVSYWMPFLSDQYGVYGLHDATWRADPAFGNTSPYSSDASHGCVEMPLATAAWIYNWAPIGTAVIIES